MTESEQIAQFIATHGVKRCPTVCAAPTPSARLNPLEQLALRVRYAALNCELERHMTRRSNAARFRAVTSVLQRL